MLSSAARQGDTNPVGELTPIWWLPLPSVSSVAEGNRSMRRRGETVTLELDIGSRQLA